MCSIYFEAILIIDLSASFVLKKLSVKCLSFKCFDLSGQLQRVFQMVMMIMMLLFLWLALLPLLKYNLECFLS